MIKLLIWQACFQDGQRLTQRALARQLGVWPSYVCKIQKQSERGLNALTREPRVALDDLLAAQRFTARLREQEQGLIRVEHSSRSERPRVLTDDEIIGNNWREVVQWKRKNLSSGRHRWFRW